MRRVTRVNVPVAGGTDVLWQGGIGADQNLLAWCHHINVFVKNEALAPMIGDFFMEVGGVPNPAVGGPGFSVPIQGQPFRIEVQSPSVPSLGFRDTGGNTYVMQLEIVWDDGLEKRPELAELVRVTREE